MLDLEQLPADLSRRAISLSNIGALEYAWLKEDALLLISKLPEKGLAVLGGDVVELTGHEAVRYTLDNWYLNKKPEWSWAEYVTRSGEYAEGYILSYPQSAPRLKADYAFVLVVATEEEYTKLQEQTLSE